MAVSGCRVGSTGAAACATGCGADSCTGAGATTGATTSTGLGATGWMTNGAGLGAVDGAGATATGAACSGVARNNHQQRQMAEAMAKVTNKRANFMVGWGGLK